MKYRLLFRRKQTAEKDLFSKPLRCRGRQTLRRTPSPDFIRLSSLFDLPSLPKGEPKKAYRLRTFFRRVGQALGKTAAFIKRILKRPARKPSSAPSILPALCGALCAVLCVGLLSASVVFYRLLLKPYYLSSGKETVPLLEGAFYDAAWEEKTLPFSLEVTYEHHDTAPEGMILSQSPAAGSIRRVSGDEPYELSLVVSLGKKSYTLEDYTARSLRDTALSLKNDALPYTVELISDETVPRGFVIATDPPAGGILYRGDTVRITVSTGREISYARVPELCGLSENGALALLAQSHLEAGEISYLPSDTPAGTVISQGVAVGESLPYHTEVSFTVSAGPLAPERSVPDLYGLTLQEARERLASFGLLCGKVYTVSGDGSAHGIVVAQSPQKGTPITSSRITVDLYICA